MLVHVAVVDKAVLVMPEGDHVLFPNQVLKQLQEHEKGNVVMRVLLVAFITGEHVANTIQPLHLNFPFTVVVILPVLVVAV